MATADSSTRCGIDIDDPFDLAFPIAMDAAQRTCADRHDPRGPCLTYHSLWPRLRRIGCAGSAWLHADTYVAAYRRIAAAGGRRILVSGAADYTLTAFVIHAFRSVGVEPEITVLDRCEAPLVINRWYVDRHQCRIHTIAGDLLDFRDDSGFDLITTDNFLARFDPDNRQSVFAKWRELLRPTGAVVTAQRINVAGTDPSDAGHKLRRIRTHALRQAEALDVSVDQLIDDAARYYRRRTFVPITSEQEIVGLFAAQEMPVETVCAAPLPDPDCRRTGGLSRATRHVAFVARLRAELPSGVQSRNR